MTLAEWLSPLNPDEIMWQRWKAGLEPDITPQAAMALCFEHSLIELERSRAGFPKGLYGPSKEPVLQDGKLGWIRVFCKECKIDYDISEVNNETTHPAALHVARFDCPKSHHCEARRVWNSQAAQQEWEEIDWLEKHVANVRRA
jgi:hypothetical protein